MWTMIKCLGAFQNALERNVNALNPVTLRRAPRGALTSPDGSLGASGRTVE